MEFLKRINRQIIILLLVLFSSVIVKGQVSTDMINAFKSSYQLERNGKYSQAAEILKTIYIGDSYELNLRIGWLDYQAGLFTESESFYNKAVSIHPMAVEARFGLVLPLAALGKWDIVIKQYTKILEIDPNNTVANYRMGSIYYGRMEYEKALQYLEKVVNLYPFDYDSMVLYAWCNYRLKKYREAKILFQKTLLIRPDDTSALEGLKLLDTQ